MTGEWQRPSTCATEACIQVNVRPDGAILRGSVLLSNGRQVFSVSPEEWAEFIAAVKAGEYDAPET